MRIGISIITHEGQNIWNNGIVQNVYHLVDALRNIPFVENVFLINCGNQDHHPGGVGDFISRPDIIKLEEAGDLADVVIEAAGVLDAQWCQRLRARGGKLIYYQCAQPYAALVETTIFARDGFFPGAGRYDAVWLLPKDADFTAMCRSMFRCTARVMPYLWSPMFIEQSIKDHVIIEQGEFGYKPGSLSNGPLNPAIFEPNLSPIKMGTIPYMICEEIFRKKERDFGKVRYMNTAGFASHPTFIFMVGNSELYKNELCSLEGRDFFAKVMAGGSNIVISHQICCEQNYLYFDALYGNYPFVHNSRMFSDVGYYYPDSDITAGVAQVMTACEEHDRNLEDYSARGKAKIWKHSPNNRNIVDSYARALIDLIAIGGTE